MVGSGASAARTGRHDHAKQQLRWWLAAVIAFWGVRSAFGSPTYTVTLLGNIGTNSSGATSSYAKGVNASKDVVGSAEKYAGDSDLGPRPVRWATGQTAATELDNLGT